MAYDAAAQGVLVKQDNDSNRKAVLANLLSAIDATGTGEWVQNIYTKAASLEISLEGTTPSATVKVYGSNAQEKPDKTIDGTQIGSDISTAGLTQISMPCRWIKAKVTAISGVGAKVTARLHQQYD